MSLEDLEPDALELKIAGYIVLEKCPFCNSQRSYFDQ